jgi:hypothetical protein
MTKIALYGALIGAISLSAQDPATLEKKLADELKAQAGNLGFVNMINGRTVKASPYSAQAVNETVQTLADGNRITRTNSSMLYRDSEGRERREEANGKMVLISDPVDRVQYTLEPQSKVARKTQRIAVGGGVGVGRGSASRPVTEGTMMTTIERTITVNGVSVGTGGGDVSTVTYRTGSPESQNSKVEHLGTQIMEGVSAEGTRTTTTIEAGQIGNEQPISIVSERWFSVDLQVAVMTKHSDPRNGTTTYKLTNINRSEPARTLFEVPSDYTLRGVGGEFRILKDNPEEQQ